MSTFQKFNSATHPIIKLTEDWNSLVDYVNAIHSGTVWYNGSGVPAVGVGANGDYYINNDNGDYYDKELGIWVLLGNLVGTSMAAPIFDPSNGELSIPAIDHAFCANNYISGTSGEALTIMNLVCLQSDGFWDQADANTEAETDGLLGFATATVGGAAALRVVLPTCIVRDDSWAFTVGSAVYASITAGGVTQVAPAASGTFVRKIGYAISADAFMFLPEATTIEVA